MTMNNYYIYIFVEWLWQFHMSVGTHTYFKKGAYVVQRMAAAMSGRLQQQL